MKTEHKESFLIENLVILVNRNYSNEPLAKDFYVYTDRHIVKYIRTRKHSTLK